MENPIDHSIDLGFVNYVKHPENDQYVVFRFVDNARMTDFKAALTRDKIWFEDTIQEKNQKQHFLFAVHHTDFKKAQRINYAVEAKHKKPFIPFGFLRWTVISIAAFVMTLAIIGYCKQQRKLDEANSLLNKVDSTITRP